MATAPAAFRDGSRGGTITPSGAYTAPAAFTNGQTVVVSATGIADPTQTAAAVVTLSNVLVTTLTASSPGPFLVGGPAAFVASVTTSTGAPAAGANVALTVAGANARTLAGVTDANGRVSFAYTGSTRGADTVQAAPTGSAGSASAALSLTWLNPVNTVTTTALTGRFFAAAACPSGCEAFTTQPTEQPAFTQNFPDLLFANATDTVLDPAGATWAQSPRRPPPVPPSSAGPSSSSSPATPAPTPTSSTTRSAPPSLSTCVRSTRLPSP